MCASSPPQLTEPLYSSWTTPGTGIDHFRCADYPDRYEMDIFYDGGHEEPEVAFSLRFPKEEISRRVGNLAVCTISIAIIPTVYPDAR